MHITACSTYILGKQFNPTPLDRSHSLFLSYGGLNRLNPLTDIEHIKQELNRH